MKTISKTKGTRLIVRKTVGGSKNERIGPAK